MQYRTLGNTNLRLSVIGIGAWQLGGPLLLDGKQDGHPELGRDFVIGLIKELGNRGINFIDTAEQYGDGESERRVGEAIKSNREKWIVSTKFGNQVSEDGRRIRDASPKRVPISLEGSLRRLQTDYIDLYQYHISPIADEAKTVLDFLLSAKQEGKIKTIGISTEKLEDVQLLYSLGGLDFVQFPMSMLSRLHPIQSFIHHHSLGGIIRGAFAQGKLSGKYFKAPPVFSADDIRNTHTQTGRIVPDEFTKYAAFEILLTPERNMIQLALRWLLDLSTTTSIIIGGKSLDDYEQAIKTLDIAPLSERDLNSIEAIKDTLLS